MLPRSRSGWICVPDSNDRATFKFEGYFDGVRVTGTARVDGDTISLIPVPGKVLELPVEGFAHLFSTLMIAAHSQPLRSDRR